MEMLKRGEVHRKRNTKNVMKCNKIDIEIIVPPTELANVYVARHSVAMFFVTIETSIYESIRNINKNVYK